MAFLTFAAPLRGAPQDEGFLVASSSLPHPEVRPKGASKDAPSIDPASCDLGWSLWNALPEFGVVAEDDARPASLQHLEPIERGEHRFAIVDKARQSALAQR